MDDIIDIEDLRKYKLPELKNLCKQNGIPSSGTKEVLVKRLATSLGMDEEDEAVDEDALLEDDDEDVGDSPVEKDSSEESLVATKPDPVPSESPEKNETNPTSDKENTASESPPKKRKIEAPAPSSNPSEMSDAERLKMRAEKYGIAKPALGSKEARAERFGLPGANKTSGKSGGGTASTSIASKNVSADDMEKMKQRSLRFGTTVSAAMTDVDSLEKIQKRKERFGDVITSPTSAKKSDSPAEDGTKQKRAERFGIVTNATKNATDDDMKKKRAERFKL